MDPSKSPSAPPSGWNAGEKAGMDQPPPYQDYSAGYNPAPGYPNQTGYPQGQPYGAPYQGQAQGPYPGQPAVTVQPTIYVAAGPLAQPLPDYLGYSIFTMLCCCLPLGVAALVFSVNTREANVSGNRPQAERSSRMARILNNTALGIGIVFIVLYLVLYITVFAVSR
ncbi:trafficking regulator of GLUT4 1-like [Pygocentrus nattereri]|uniref:trafficking regulator of GLUT4 1-like n=1 Tax=Pygocentrus nattereri TaxID=42514 RepID=UPI000814496A|nr:trafficking regulator of GLUT4 1-like [Pygocentrus nattereri]